jgi:hypothetical protein
MFCPNCGRSVEIGVKFCENCGTKMTANIAAPRKSAGKTNSPVNNVALFYSQEWYRVGFFTAVSRPYFDILVDKDYLSLIALPSYSAGAWGMLLGLIVFNIIGAIIGASMGNSSDRNKRREYRSFWIDANNNLISRGYERDIFLKIPVSELKNSLIFKNKKLTVYYNGVERSIKKNQSEIDRLNNYLKDHVL